MFQQFAEPLLADLQRLVPHVHTVIREKVKGVQPHVRIAFAAVEGVEIGDPIRPQDYGLTIDDERGLAQPQGSLNDQGKALGPIMPVAGEQADADAVALDD
jgi:hypothetical protein